MDGSNEMEGSKTDCESRTMEFAWFVTDDSDRGEVSKMDCDLRTKLVLWDTSKDESFFAQAGFLICMVFQES